MRMHPKLTKDQWEKKTIPGGLKTWFRAAECRFLMPAAPICWRQHCTAPAHTPVCRFGCAFLHNPWDLGLESLESRFQCWEAQQCFAKCTPWSTRQASGTAWTNPTSPSSPTLLQPRPSNSAHRSSCCSSGNGPALPLLSRKEKQRTEDPSKGRKWQRNTSFSAQLQDIFPPLVAEPTNKSMLI